ncbi:DUF3291 domain-containing protein [Ruegeria jejuensis]|uniref:DUF3291 domain-containing protein n=1 Tax=Ruegeria jejuensis TaxID=3233338 RepID=UPI00355BFDAF
MKHLAQINISHLRYDVDDRRLQDFLHGFRRVNNLAERSPGFQWRYVGDSGVAMQTTLPDRPDMIANLSVWNSIEALEHFVWATAHRPFFDRRAEWFRPLDSAHFAMWWVDPGTEPGLEEALARLDHLTQHGDSDVAFGWTYLPQANRWRQAWGADATARTGGASATKEEAT